LDKDKRKVMVLGALAVVVVAVGAFQFTSMSASPPKKETKAAKKSEKDPALRAVDEAKRVEKVADARDTVEQVEQAPPPSTKPDDATAIEAPTPESERPIGTPLEGTQAPELQPQLKLRDPFVRGALPADPNALQPAQPFAQKPVQPVQTGRRPSPPRLARSGGRSIPPFNPVGPLPGAFPGGGGGGVEITPRAIPQPSDELGYTVSGVMLGNKPVAVFQDKSGGQRLVALGGSLDGDTKVVGIERGKVKVKLRGKTVTLSMGGTSVDK
jgi:hypothetical protein